MVAHTPLKRARLPVPPPSRRNRIYYTRRRNFVKAFFRARGIFFRGSPSAQEDGVGPGPASFLVAHDGADVVQVLGKGELVAREVPFARGDARAGVLAAAEDDLRAGRAGHDRDAVLHVEVMDLRPAGGIERARAQGREDRLGVPHSRAPSPCSGGTCGARRPWRRRRSSCPA